MSRERWIGLTVLIALLVSAGLLVWDDGAAEREPAPAAGARSSAPESPERKRVVGGVGAVEPPLEDFGEIHIEAPGQSAETYAWDKVLAIRVVSDDDGAPLEGAAVRTMVSHAADSFRTGITDADGRVDLPVCRWSMTVWVRKPGFRLFTQDARHGFDAPLDVRLKRGRSLRGRVVHARDGSPVEHAEVFAWDAATETEVDVDPLRYDDRDGDGLITDSEGRFELAGVHPDHALHFAVRATGAGVTELRIEADAIGSEVTIRVGSGGVLHGKVTIDGRAPAADATVYAVLAGDDFGIRLPDSRWLTGGDVGLAATAKTDAEGRYRIEGLAVPARYVAVAHGPASAPGAGDPATKRAGTARPSMR